jgi:hypothetical protein
MKQLVLRSPGKVGKASLLSPLAAIGAFWLCFAAVNVPQPHSGIVLDLILIPGLVIFGAPVCAIVEFIVVAPLVFGLRTYQWRWLNWGWVVPIGFFAGALPVVLVVGATEDLRDLLQPNMLQIIAGFGIAGVAGAVTFGRIATTPAAG